MNTEPTDIRAPAGAVAWTPAGGWVYDAADLPDHIEDGHYALTVSTDGIMRVSGTATAPLVAVLRVDADLTALVERVADLDRGAPREIGRALREVDDVRMKVLDAAERLAQSLSQPPEAAGE